MLRPLCPGPEGWPADGDAAPDGLAAVPHRAGAHEDELLPRHAPAGQRGAVQADAGGRTWLLTRKYVPDHLRRLGAVTAVQGYRLHHSNLEAIYLHLDRDKISLG